MTDTFLDSRLTERRNPRTAEIDRATPLQIVDLITAEDAGVPEAVARMKPEIARTIELLEAAFRSGGRLFYVGAGTSGRLGVLDAASGAIQVEKSAASGSRLTKRKPSHSAILAW